MMSSVVHRSLHWIAHADRLGVNLMRIGTAIIFAWIGWLKFIPYEADSITVFVANSPFMSFFYTDPENYKAYFTHEGELDAAKRAWQVANNTYGFSTGLGIVELIIAGLLLANPVSRWLGFAGGLMSFLTPFITLTFLYTTPETWVPALGDAHHGFPYLSGAGRLVLKDCAILAGGFLIMSDSARDILRNWAHAQLRNSRMNSSAA